ncbi:MAG: J domain-containing protein [Pseudomonadota bacterium]
MKDCWEVLGISSDSDERTIKRAYSGLLKKTRPEDDPAGFEQLHAAYKAARQHARWMREDDELESGEVHMSLPEMAVNEAEESHEVPHAELSEPSSLVAPITELTSTQRATIEALMERLEEMRSVPMSLGLIPAWEFILSHPGNVDDSFRLALGQRVLDFVVEVEATAQRQGKAGSPLHTELMARLNMVFLWTYHHYEYDWPDGDINGLVARMSESPRPTTAVKPLGGHFVERLSEPNFDDPNRPSREIKTNWEDLALKAVGGFYVFGLLVSQCS